MIRGISFSSFIMHLFLILGMFFCLSGETVSQEHSPGNEGKVTPSSHLFVASSSKKYTDEGKNLFVIDITRSLEAPLKAVVSIVPLLSRRFAFTEDGALCISGNDSQPEVVLIDSEKAIVSPTESIISKVSLRASPSHIIISRGRPLAFVVENGAKLIEVVDIMKARNSPGESIITRFKLRAPVMSMTISPDNSYLIAADEKVRLFDVARIFSEPERAEVSTVSTSLSPGSLMLDPARNFLYLSDISGTVLTVMGFDKTLSPLRFSELYNGRAKLGPSDRLSRVDECHMNLSLDPQASHLFMAHPGLDRLSIIDIGKATCGESNWGVSSISTGRCPLQVCFTPQGKETLVNNYLSGNIYIYDTAKCITSPLEALLRKIAIPSPCYIGIKPRYTKEHN